MPKTDFIASNDEQFAASLDLFKNNIGSYAATIGVTPAQVTAQAADAAHFDYVLGRAIYRVGDAAVGQWSSPVSITVGG